MSEKKKSKVRYVDINAHKESFVSKFVGGKKPPHDFSDIQMIRKLLSNEKARILYLLKHKKPKSIYKVAKMLGRDFKSVREDMKFLERFGFIEFFAEKKGRRESLMPVLAVERLQVIISI